MDYQKAHFSTCNCTRFTATLRAILAITTKCRGVRILLTILLLGQTGGCVSDKVQDGGLVSLYQQTLAGQGPQQRANTEGREALVPLGLLQPEPEPVVSEIEAATDLKTGKEVYTLTIEEAILRALANSPEIRVVSFDPSIAKEEITKEAAEFDMTAFGRVNYEKQDNPINSFSTISQANERLAESGIKQKFATGTEWSASYALTRNWDDLPGRPLPTRYEPIFAFQVRQPLLRDAWKKVNLAGVDIARLNHEIALLSFRQKAEDISTQVISAYWLLFQARRNLEIQKELLDRTIQTLERLRGREDIDATAVQLKQTEAAMKAREGLLVQVRKSVVDAQDELVRIMADAQMNLLDSFDILAATTPNTQILALDDSELLRTAIQNNPIIQQARIGITIADINIDVAKNREMPRLDMVASANFQGLARQEGDAQDRLNSGDFASYAIGFSFEYPLGNRQRKAEFVRRRLERSKAVSFLQDIADRVARLTKERARKVQTNHAELQIQKDAVAAASTHLQVLEDTEMIRERLTPEFLLVKLQGQDDLATAQRAEVRAVADFNSSLAQLAQATGTVLELHQLRSALPIISGQQSN